MEEQVEAINNHLAPQLRIPYRLRVAVADVFFSDGRDGDDTCSCLVSLIILCFFVSLILILGFFSSFDLVLGPNSSRLLRSNSFLVQDVQVKAVSGPKHELMLYGFSDPPPLDINVAWSESHDSSVPPNAQKAWVYYLNQGAHINISYSITPQGLYPLILVIAQGRESLSRWIEDPSDPNVTLFWKLIDGTGIVHQDIVEPSDHYIAVANLNQIKMEVQLRFGIQALFYNTSGAYFKCSLHHKQCDWKLFFLQENSAILTTSQDDANNEWYVRLSYGPRWSSYFICSGVVTLSIFMVYKIVVTLQSNSTGEGTPQVAEGVTETTSLLAGEDIDDQSLGSSYDSVSNDEETDQLTALYLPIDGESEKHQCLCMICGNAQKDCFFLPCGHCATCFTCGNRLLNNGDTCPVCQRNTKKLRKIFSA
ncbi:E3 ubiquitin-protein ligase APD2-like isoform X1 [Dioscorea cayenensis subsp. rotundata]|uniref:E3 ubiquitin-protein ligase APD2-like isoform X1 n=1 Tax=Dioscorea cayennensis subsp. rotundata TaxID=55577 RepID=A0AB40B8Z9_DIOCR|nr:E3 ubiquitin-protein ligase APD2-like isoform X1 [Dioscorea cayenensis subsp. rotundata]